MKEVDAVVALFPNNPEEQLEEQLADQIWSCDHEGYVYCTFTGPHGLTSTVRCPAGIVTKASKIKYQRELRAQKALPFNLFEYIEAKWNGMAAHCARSSDSGPRKAVPHKQWGQKQREAIAHLYRERLIEVVRAGHTSGGETREPWQQAFHEVCVLIAKSPFLSGAEANSRNWRVTLGWAVKLANFDKIVEGRYAGDE